jgi:hypothetical protein
MGLLAQPLLEYHGPEAEILTLDVRDDFLEFLVVHGCLLWRSRIESD